MPHRYFFIGLAILSLLALGFLHWLGLTTTFGTGDEAIYVVTAKALAEGHGYRILSQWGDPFQIAYPPLYPTLLAAVWWLNPHFPGNLFALKGLNLIFAAIAAVMTYQLVVNVYGAPRSRGWTAALLLGVSGPYFVLMNAAMSEMPFVAATAVALRYLEPLVADRERRTLPDIAAMAALATLPMMVRSASLALCLALVAWLLLRREWRATITLALLLVAFNLPWQAWVAYVKHAGGSVSFGYTGWILENTDGLNPSRLAEIARGNAFRIYQSVAGAIAPALGHAAFHKVLRLIGAPGLVPALTAGVAAVAAAGYLAIARRQLRIMHLYLVFYLLMILIFPWHPYRYVIVLIPFLLICYTEGAFAALPALARWRGLRPLGIGAVAGVVALSASFGAFRVYEFARYRTFHDGLLGGQGLQQHTDARALAAWARTALPPEAAWISECDGCTYMYTGRKAFLYKDGATPRPVSQAFFNSTPTYMLVNVVGTPGQNAFRCLAATNPDRVRQVFVGPAGQWKVYRLSSDWPAPSNATSP